MCCFEIKIRFGRKNDPNDAQRRTFKNSSSNSFSWMRLKPVVQVVVLFFHCTNNFKMYIF
jgi:hypothetical protein